MPKKTVPTGFALRLKELREAAGLTQDALAERAGLYKFSISKLEQGIREPTWGTVQVLARALGIPCTAFEEAIIADTADAPKKGPGRPPKAKPAEATQATKARRKKDE